MKHRVFEHQVSGGAAGLVVHVPGSDVACLQLRFNSGFQFADRAKYEVPHIMEHLLATVTQAHPGPNEFNIEVQKNGAYMNASTGIDVNAYIYECADFEWERIVGLATEQLSAPLFAHAPFMAERGNVKEELSRNTTQHAAVCSMALAQAAFPDLWLDYDRRLAQLPSIEIEDLHEHYRRTHTAANARFFVAGDFADGGERLAGYMDELFKQLPVGERLACSRQIGRGLERPVVIERDIAQIYYRMSLYFGELDEPGRRALALLRMLLVGGMGSRVLGEARRRGLAYSVGAAGHAEPGNSSFGFVGYVTPANALALYELMARELGAVARGEATEQELSAAKDLMIGSIKRSTQTPGDLLAWYVDPYDESGEIRDFERSLELVRDTTLEEVASVAELALTSHRRGAAFVGPIATDQAQRYFDSFRNIS